MFDEKLFGDFKGVSAEEWNRRIQKDLKEDEHVESLNWISPEGIKVEPFYRSNEDDVSPVDIVSSAIAWKAGQTVQVDYSADSSKRISDAIYRGAEVLRLTIPSEDIQIEDILKSVEFDDQRVHLNLRFLSLDYIRSARRFFEDKASSLHINLDVIGHLCSTGNWFFDREKDFGILQDILDQSTTNQLNVDLSLYQNSGADMVQQLAYTLAHTNEYLNRFGEDWAKEDVIGRKKTATESVEKWKPISFNVAVGSNYFFEIAKLRALRWLWRTLAQEYGITSDCQIVATPSKRNKTLYDYNTNMLRTTTECMSAVLGGADVIFNLPYDSLYHESNEFGERIALNQLLLLKNESHFDKVGNPADGAYYVESLTRQLAEKALQLFKKIESAGGFLAQLKAGTIQKSIGKSAEKEQQRFDSEKKILIGTNKYQNPTDRMKNDLERHPFARPGNQNTDIEPIMEKRLAEAMEKKRLEEEG